MDSDSDRLLVMTPTSFAKILLTHKKLTACYIAVMPNGGNYDLEVEDNESTIAGVYDTSFPATAEGLAMARKDADELDRALTQLGVKVFTDWKSWEEYLAI